MDNTYLFETPTKLPPSRYHGYKITIQEVLPQLISGLIVTLNVQKDEIEKMVEEMINSGVILDNTSPYSLPIMILKKKDES